MNDIDMNLLVVLDALLATQSTTQTARRLGKTQSTISHALERLRQAFGDPLLVRVGRNLAPTPRATALAEPLRAWLASGRELMQGSRELVPGALRATFTVIANDFAEAIVLPRLIPALRERAPGVTLEVTLRGDESEQAVRDGRVDLFIGTFVRDLDGLVTQALYEDQFAVVMRSRHPLTRGTLTLDRFVAAEHVLVTPRGLPGGIVDDRLAAARRTRTVALRTPSFTTAAQLAATTDLITTLPASFARSLATTWPLALRDVPLQLPRMTVQQVFRTTRRDDRPLAWLRALIHEVCAPLR